MEYVSVSARFLFFNGVKQYTVEFAYSLFSWYVFNNDELSNAVYIKKDNRVKLDNVNRMKAENVLYEYLQKT